MAIATDAFTNGGSTTGTSHTFSHTCTGANRILFVQVEIENATDVITGVTYNGVAMTLVQSQANTSPSEVNTLWVLVAPATGANNVVVSTSSSVSIGAIAASYTGAAQTGQPDASGKKTSQATSSTLSVTTIADNCWMVSCVQADAGLPTAGTGITARVDESNASFGDSNGVITPPGSNSMTWNAGGTWHLNHINASFAPAVAAGGNFLALL